MFYSITASVASIFDYICKVLIETLLTFPLAPIEFKVHNNNMSQSPERLLGPVHYSLLPPLTLLFKIIDLYLLIN